MISCKCGLLKQQIGIKKLRWGCKQPERSKRYSALCVDHCHKTGKIRGLLCNQCNRALGLLQDSRHNVAELFNYISKN